MKHQPLDITKLIAEFDHELRIVHQTADEPLYFRTHEEAKILADVTDRNLSRLLGPERGYLVTNISRIVIEPTVVDLYVNRINELISKYLHPHGIARYGYAIGRVTVRIGHESKLLEDLNLFGTKEEAVAYIRELDSKRREVEEAFSRNN